MRHFIWHAVARHVCHPLPPRASRPSRHLKGGRRSWPRHAAAAGAQRPHAADLGAARRRRALATGASRSMTSLTGAGGRSARSTGSLSTWQDQQIGRASCRERV